MADVPIHEFENAALRVTVWGRQSDRSAVGRMRITDLASGSQIELPCTTASCEFLADAFDRARQLTRYLSNGLSVEVWREDFDVEYQRRLKAEPPPKGSGAEPPARSQE